MRPIVNIFFIGGSPCSGKSTIAEMLSQKYGLYYYKVDDHLDHYTRMGAEAGYPICVKQTEMTAEDIWMRSPEVQCKEELQFYREVFGFLLDDLNKLASGCGIITEGAACLPQLMKEIGVPDNRYIAMVPTAAFQINYYSKREWVPYVLAGCSDPEKAFRNWMERDILFAKEVAQQCGNLNYKILTNNGNLSIGHLEEIVKAHFDIDSYLR